MLRNDSWMQSPWRPQGVGADVTVLVPSEERVRFIIDTLARFILDDGTDLEQLVLEAEAHNPEFDFLRNVDSPEHMYYRWRLYSLCNEDSMAQWRTEPFVMIEGSHKIYPPPLAAGGLATATAAQQGMSGCFSFVNALELVMLIAGCISHRELWKSFAASGSMGWQRCTCHIAWHPHVLYTNLTQSDSVSSRICKHSQSSRARLAGGERDSEAQLSELERERLEDMLRGLRVERAAVRDAMLFALDHAGSAAEISETLVASLTLDETPAHLKVSRCAATQPGPSVS